MPKFEKTNPTEFTSDRLEKKNTDKNSSDYEEEDLISDDGYEEGEDPREEYDLDKAKKEVDRIIADKKLAEAIKKKEQAEREKILKNMEEDRLENEANFRRF